MLKRSGVALLVPDPIAIHAAEEAAKATIAEEARIRKIAKQNAPRPTLGEIWSLYRDRLKGLFLKPPNESGGSPSQTPAARIRPVPVMISTLLMSGVIAIAVRRWLRRKPSSATSR